MRPRTHRKWEIVIVAKPVGNPGAADAFVPTGAFERGHVTQISESEAFRSHQLQIEATHVGAFRRNVALAPGEYVRRGDQVLRVVDVKDRAGVGRFSRVLFKEADLPEMEAANA